MCGYTFYSGSITIYREIIYEAVLHVSDIFPQRTDREEFEHF